MKIPPENEPTAVWNRLIEYDNSDLSAKYSIKINIFSDSDLQDFAKLIGAKISKKTKYVNFRNGKTHKLKSGLWVDEDAVGGRKRCSVKRKDCENDEK